MQRPAAPTKKRTKEARETISKHMYVIEQTGGRKKNTGCDRLLQPLSVTRRADGVGKEPLHDEGKYISEDRQPRENQKTKLATQKDAIP